MTATRAATDAHRPGGEPPPDAPEDLRTSLGTLVEIAVVAAFATLGLRPLGDPDLGWHLRTGELVIHHGFTTTDPWSFASSQPWVLHEWGGEVLMYASYALAGYPGVIAWRFALTGLLGLLLIRACRRHAGSGISVVITCLAFLTLWPRMTERPQLLSFCILAAVLPALRESVQRGRSPWWLPAVILVWVNVHAMWSIGLLFYGALTLGRILEVGPSRWREYRSLIAIGALCGLALLGNPSGVHVLGILHVGGGSFIGEFATPSLASSTNVSTAVLILIVVLAWARGSSPVRSTVLIFVLVAVGVGLMYERTVPVAAIALAPVAAEAWASHRGATQAGRQLNPRDKVGVAVLALAFVVAAFLKLQSVPPLIDDMPVTTPVQLDALPGRARVLNEYGFGGWLLWTAPNTSPGIDGRSEVYATDYVSGYLASLAMRPGWRQFVMGHGYTAAWLHRSTPVVQGLREMGWRTVGREGDTVILVPPAQAR